MGFTKKEMEEKGFTEEQINFIMAERGKEIEAEKVKLADLKNQLTEKENSIAELSEKAKNLDGTETTLKELQEKITSYEQKEQERIKAEESKKVESELKQRFLSLVGENKFKHEDIENGRFAAFKNALSDEKYKGKGDSDIFADITKDMDLYVNPQQQPITSPSGSLSITSDLSKMSYDEYKAFRKGAN